MRFQQSERYKTADPSARRAYSKKPCYFKHKHGYHAREHGRAKSRCSMPLTLQAAVPEL